MYRRGCAIRTQGWCERLTLEYNHVGVGAGYAKPRQGRLTFIARLVLRKESLTGATESPAGLPGRVLPVAGSGPDWVQFPHARRFS